MAQPYDYTLNAVNPINNLIGSLNLASGIQKYRSDVAAQEQAQQTQQSISQDLAQLGPNVSSDDIKNLMIKYPTMSEKFKGTFDILTKGEQGQRISEATDAYAALRSGRPDIAMKSLNEHAQAYRNSGMEDKAKVLEDMAKTVELSPETAKLSTGMFLAHAMGPDKFAETFKTFGEEERKTQLQPGVIKKQAADLNLTNAQTNKELVAARKMEAEIAKTNAEASKVAADAAQRAMELKYGKPVELTTEGEKLLNKSVADAANSASLATQYDNLAGQIEEEISTAGAPGRAAEVTKRFFGSENQVTRLRQEYQRLRNSAVLTMLPPGVASDKDIEIAMGAFPSETSNPELIASFMRGMAKMQRYDSRLNNMKAEWISEVGNLGKAKQGAQVDGEDVMPGTTFNDFVESKISVPDTISEQEDQPSAQPSPAPVEATVQPNIQALLDKYGVR